MNYYPFHIGDYLSATRHLSWEEDAAYRRLLDTYYVTEKPLPLDLRAVCRLVLAQTDTQRAAVEVVLEEFFERTDDGWINARADAEISSMREKQEKQRAKANKRWNKPSNDQGNAASGGAALPRHDEVDATASNHDAVAMPPTPTPTPTPDIDSACEHAGLPPDSLSDSKSGKQKRSECTLSTYLAECGKEGRKAVPDDHFIRGWAQNAGISDEMMQVAWYAFRDAHIDGTSRSKRYKDWPGAFANSVKQGWYRLWFIPPTGEAEWTTQGRAMLRNYEGVAA